LSRASVVSDPIAHRRASLARYKYTDSHGTRTTFRAHALPLPPPPLAPFFRMARDVVADAVTIPSRPADHRRPTTRRQALFGDMNDHLEEWKKGQDLTFEHQQERIESFQGQAEALIQGLEDVRTVLEEKEFQLWEKEGLLEYQEEVRHAPETT
jgi:hypothetical protein